MKVGERIVRWFLAPVLTRKRIWFAFTVAATTDAIQLFLGPVGWAFLDEGLDVIAMVLTSASIGFHMLLLPTFVIELLPVADMLPTWTACTAAVVMLRKRAQAQPPPMPMKMAKVTEPPPGNL
jgi:hypothetical protein